MFRNFILSAHRNVMRNKLQSVIQIASLAIGITIFTMIAFYLYDEFTVDNDNEFRDNIYRVENREGPFATQDVVPIRFGPRIKENIPEIMFMTRIFKQIGVPLV